MKHIEPVGPDKTLLLEVKTVHPPVYTLVMRGYHIYDHDGCSWYRAMDGVLTTVGATPAETWALALAAKDSRYYLEVVARKIVTRLCRATHDQWLAEADTSKWIGNKEEPPDGPMSD